MRSYLQKASSLGGKKAIIFVTYASGFGKEHCLDSLEQALKEKGVHQIIRFSVSQFKITDKVLIERLIQDSLSSLGFSF